MKRKAAPKRLSTEARGGLKRSRRADCAGADDIGERHREHRAPITDTNGGRSVGNQANNARPRTPREDVTSNKKMARHQATVFSPLLSPGLAAAEMQERHYGTTLDLHGAVRRLSMCPENE